LQNRLININSKYNRTLDFLKKEYGYLYVFLLGSESFNFLIYSFCWSPGVLCLEHSSILQTCTSKQDWTSILCVYNNI